MKACQTRPLRHSHGEKFVFILRIIIDQAPQFLIHRAKQEAGGIIILFLAHGFPHTLRRCNDLRYGRKKAIGKILPNRRDNLLVDVLHDDFHAAQRLRENLQPLAPKIKQRRLERLFRMDDEGRDDRPCRVALQTIQTPDALLDAADVPRKVDVDEAIRALEIPPLTAGRIAKHHAARGFILKAIGVQLDLFCGHPFPEEADLFCWKHRGQRLLIGSKSRRLIGEEDDLLIVKLVIEKIHDRRHARAAILFIRLRIVENRRQIRQNMLLLLYPLRRMFHQAAIRLNPTRFQALKLCAKRPRRAEERAQKRAKYALDVEVFRLLRHPFGDEPIANRLVGVPILVERIGNFLQFARGQEARTVVTLLEDFSAAADDVALDLVVAANIGDDDLHRIDAEILCGKIHFFQ